MKTEGVHEIADVWLKTDIPEDLADVISMQLLGPGKMTILKSAAHYFEPAGETWMWLLAESHCSLHTFPEHRYLSIDIYGCGKGNPTAAMTAILENLDILHLQRACAERGNREGS